jgi:hypothetical protein
MSAPTGNTFFSHKAVALAPGQEVAHRVTGSQFVCRSSQTGAAAEADFLVSFDDGEFVPGWSGVKFTFPRPDFFTAVRLRNPGLAAITVDFYTGSGDLSQLA